MVRLVDPERLEYLFGPAAGEVVDQFDLESESDRMQVVEQHLVPPDEGSDGARVALRAIAVTQILDDDPPETWRTVQRLRAGGIDRERVLSQLSMVLAEQISAAAEFDSPFDRAAYVAALDELPLPSWSDAAHAAVDAVRARPGISVDEHTDGLVASLSASGSEVVRSLVDRVVEDLSDGPLHFLPGDVTAHVPDLVDGRVFTHRFNEVEAELGVLTAGFDLGAFARFDAVRLADGTELDQYTVERDHLAWRGPAGWLAAFQTDDLLAVTVEVSAPDGGVDEPVAATVTIDVLEPEPVVTDEAVAAVRSAYEAEIAEPGLPVSGEELALWLCFHRSELFTDPHPPLAELCAAAGLDLRGGRVAHDESIWLQDLWHRRFHRVMDMVPEAGWGQVLGPALRALDDPDASVDEVRQALDQCAEPETLDALVDVLFPHYLELSDAHELGRADAPGRLFELVARATAVARRPTETATAEYLACVLYERCAAPDVAEEHLTRAVNARPRLGPIVERIGWYRFDRGDARGAVTWWRTLTELPDAAAAIEPFLAPSGRPKLGRNQPCWCGSGRKYKQCHQNATELPELPDRVGWLCRKASLWLEHCVGDARDTVLQMALARATGDPDADVSDIGDLDHAVDLLHDAFDDPIVFDAALTEAGLFKLFLHERAALLPEDEQLLAASWQTVDRSVHEVVAVERGDTLTLRDLATGEVDEVRERTLSRDAQVGERYCARVAPDGAGHQIIGGVFPVRIGHEETVLDLCAEGDGAELCAWVGALHQPPRIVHTPGLLDSMIDRGAVDAAMAELGDDADEDALLDLLGTEISRQTGESWLDQQIPALAGLTPREAAADPTRRLQLVQLLDEFDRMDERFESSADDAPGGFRPIHMDTIEIRRQLGL